MRRLDPRLAGIGLAGGVLSGLFGIGGGVVIVPLLVVFLGYGQREAQTASLAAIVPISLVGVATYAVHGEVRWEIGTALAIGALGGSVIGVRLLAGLDERVLRLAFGVLLVVAGIATALR
jgi:uncharacterized membrane protein YfcA